jgi:hypothetical protein
MKNCKNFNIAISIIIIGIVSVLGFQNYQKLAQDRHFEQIVSDLNNLEFEPANEAIRQNFISEIQNIYTTENPEIDKNIKYAWVLSTRHSYTKIPINSDAQNIGAEDKEDGYNRIRLGINIAREVAAKKLDKQESNLTSEELQKYGPIILFNGGAYDNSLLTEALDNNIITDYPKESFYIFMLPENQINTGGQFKTLYIEHEKGNIDLNNLWKSLNKKHTITYKQLQTPEDFDRRILIREFLKIQEAKLDTFSVGMSVWSKYLWRKRYKKSSNLNQERSNITCSELIAKIYHASEVIKKKYDPGSYYTKDFIENNIEMESGFKLI